MSAQSTYAFKARDAAGEIVTGTMLAVSADEVGAKLRAEGKYVLAVDVNAMRASITREEVQRHEAARRVRRDDVIAFCQQLSVMLETGVPLSEALESFTRQTPRKEFRTVLASLTNDIHSGEPLSRAMTRWPKVFPTMVISLMKASEASGTMSMMLGRVGSYLDKERRTARQIKGAISYPLFMVTTGLGMTVFLMAFVLPRFAKIYESRSATLPTPTKILMGISDFIVNQWMIYIPSLIAVTIGWYFWTRQPSGRQFVDWIKLNFPVLKTIFGQLYITRAARTMATLLAAGVNLLDIIEICRGVTNNTYYDRLWRSMEQGVRDGKQISDAVFESTIIPPNVASMITSGEKSGRLAQVMEKIAEFSEQELDGAVKQATSFIEPCMIIIMGVIVGGVAMALLLPIFSMGRVVSGSG